MEIKSVVELVAEIEEFVRCLFWTECCILTDFKPFYNWIEGFDRRQKWEDVGDIFQRNEEKLINLQLLN